MKRLRPDAFIRPFDTAEGGCRFLVGVDNRHFVVSGAVAAVLEETRHAATLVALAKRASARLGRRVTPAEANRLLCEQAPAFFFDPAEPLAGHETPLRARRELAGAGRLAPLVGLAARLFTARAAIPLALAFVLVELLVGRRAGASGAHAFSAVQLALAVGLTLASILAHELGHLAACARYGARYGGIGIGLYWCVPVFYADVRGAWVLPRRQRAVVDAGGVYLQGGFVLILGLAWLLSPAPALLSAISCSHFLMLHTLNPVLKYDGYWLLADLTGTYNLHRRIRSIAQRLRRALLGAREDMPSARELMLLCAFSGAAGAYFAYLLVTLGRSIALAASAAALGWSADDHSALHLLEMIGRATLLAALLAVGAGTSLLLARSLRAVVEGGHHDR